MKKSLILLPLLALAVSSCTIGGGSSGKKKKSSSGQTTSVTSDPSKSSGSQSSGSGSSGSSSKTSSSIAPVESWPAEGVAPTEFGVNFDVTPGTHTVSYDFVKNYSQYSGSGNETFPYVGNDTGWAGGYMDGMPIVSNGCYCGNYQGSGYMMMKNKDRSTVSFIGNSVSLGAITKVEFVCGSSASTAQVYDVTLSKEFTTSASTSGEAFNHPGGTKTASESDGYGFFKISTKDSSKNGQIGTLSITYVIS